MKGIFLILIFILFLIYLWYTFIIFYHLIKLEDGPRSKLLTLLFLLVSFLLLFVAIIACLQIDWGKILNIILEKLISPHSPQ